MFYNYAIEYHHFYLGYCHAIDIYKSYTKMDFKYFIAREFWLHIKLEEAVIFTFRSNQELNELKCLNQHKLRAMHDKS